MIHSIHRRCATTGLLSLAGLLTLVAGAGAIAGEPEVGAALPFEFQPGEPARASEVNQNFEALMTMVDGLQAQVAGLESELALLNERTQFLSVSNDAINGLAGPHLLIEGANVHVRSGSGETDDFGMPAGLGNLVVGYNEEPEDLGAGERGGAHNLVVGQKHKYSSTGGIVAGEDNEITGRSASVLGGMNNTASGLLAVVSGGSFNSASGEESSVSGGVSNFASALRSSASGGAQNTASGIASSISGGSGGATGGFAASISGGQSGIASGDQSSISGGQSNSAFGNKSAISGGFNQTVTEDFDWRACDVTCQ